MEHIWYKSYQEGIEKTVDINLYANINQIIDQSCRDFADRPSFTCMGTVFTYSELREKIDQFAAFLQNELGLKKGDRLAIMMPNLLQYPIALFGALKVGLVVVNVNPLYTATELKHQLLDSGASAIVIFENACSTLEAISKDVNLDHVIVTGIGDMLSFPKNILVNAVIKYVKKMVPKWNLKSFHSFSSIFKGNYGRAAQAELNHSDIAFLQYTGGTTGVSKGAILTHGNIVSNMIQAREWIKLFIEPGKEVIITPLPLYHIFSLTANCLVFSSVGAQNILITNPRDFPGFVKELSKYKFTAFTGVNTLFNALLNCDSFSSLDFSHLKLTLGGGMAVQKSVAEKWKKVTGAPLIEAYGLTETSPAACINPMDLKDYNGFIGLPISSTEVKILDEDDKEVAIGEVGEIAIKGPQVMEGYWNRPDETEKVMTSDKFFKTGDVGFMTEDGFVKIVDRKKDMILVSGFNVYPNEIEDVMAQHPKILESAAVGIPDEKSGEVVKLFVVKKDPSLTKEEVMQHCKDSLTNYKHPKEIEFRDELPKTNVGKILRRKLRD